MTTPMTPELLYDAVHDFWKSVDGLSPTDRSAALAMVVATWLAAHPKHEREKALNHHLEVLHRVMPLVVEKCSPHYE